MKLPIERVPNTVPPQFRYKYPVNKLEGGVQLIEQVGCVPPSMEQALIALITIAEKQDLELQARS